MISLLYKNVNGIEHTKNISVERQLRDIMISGYVITNPNRIYHKKPVDELKDSIVV
jgi:regulatory protein YycI of two-component signal transduction system YycFG